MILKYEKIKQDIVQDIENGKFNPGDKIYSEGDLKKMYSVSSTTVVKALNDLVSEGYLIRRQGEGTFVRKHLKRQAVLYSESLGSKIKQTSNRIVEKTYTAVSEPFQNASIAKKLGDKEGKIKMVRISQVATVNNFPWKLQNRFIRAEQLSELAKQRLREGASLSDELHLPYNLIKLPFTMDIMASTEADIMDNQVILAEMQLDFDYTEEIMFFKVMKTMYDTEGAPLEYDVSFIHPNYYSIHIETK